MGEASTTSVVGAAQDNTLARRYRRFADADVHETSPLDARVAVALSGSGEALRGIEQAPARRRHPRLILAALHDLALAGRAPRLAAAYAAGDRDAATAAAVATMREFAGEIASIAARRAWCGDELGRHAVLYPAVAEAARRVGATSLGLIDVGRPAAFNLNVGQARITYDSGVVVGDPSSALQVSASAVGGDPIPDRALPPVGVTVSVDSDPLDPTDVADARWLRACIPPDRPDRRAMVDAELQLAARNPPQHLRGDAIDVLPDVLAGMPGDVLPVVLTTWVLSRYRPERRRQFLDTLTRAAAVRPVAWVSVEGVGVAPAVPTLGDRPASGHSIVGRTIQDGAARETVVLGRCWSRGRLMSWLADS